MVDTIQSNALTLVIPKVETVVVRINLTSRSTPIHGVFALGYALNIGTSSGAEAYKKWINQYLKSGMTLQLPSQHS